MKVISYSLFLPNGRLSANSLKYVIGMFKNILLAEELYPDWYIFIHIDYSIPQNLIDLLQLKKMVRLVFHDYKDGLSLTAHRFIPPENENIEVMLCRDADSLLTKEDKDNVDRWLDTDIDIMTYHKDRKNYQWNFLAGTLGMKGNAVNMDWDNEIDNWCKIDKLTYYGGDQDFLDYFLKDKPTFYIHLHDNNHKDTGLFKYFPLVHHLPKISNSISYIKKLLKS